jgi:hypothetical protein
VLFLVLRIMALTFTAVLDLIYVRSSRGNSPDSQIARSIYKSIDFDVLWHIERIREERGGDIGEKDYQWRMAHLTVSDYDIRQFLETIMIGQEIGPSDRNLFDYLDSASNTPDNIKFAVVGRRGGI